VGLAVGAAAYDYPLRRAVGPVIRGLVSFLLITAFLWWTMHFLLAGRRRWRQLIRPAIVTSLLWFGLADRAASEVQHAGPSSGAANKAASTAAHTSGHVGGRRPLQ
jgi:hypothetical protein